MEFQPVFSLFGAYAADPNNARSPCATSLALLIPCLLAYASAWASKSFSTVNEIVLAPFPTLGLPNLFLKRFHCLRSCAFNGRERARRSTGASASISLTIRSFSESGSAIKSSMTDFLGFRITAYLIRAFVWSSTAWRVLRMPCHRHPAGRLLQSLARPCHAQQ